MTLTLARNSASSFADCKKTDRRGAIKKKGWGGGMVKGVEGGGTPLKNLRDLTHTLR